MSGMGFMNAVMAQTLAAAQAAAHKQATARMAQEAEAKRQQEARELAARQAAEAEQRRIAEEALRKEQIFVSASQELTSPTSGQANIIQIYGNPANHELIGRFAALDPLRIAVVNDHIGAVAILLDNGLTMTGWQDLVDEGTEMYNTLRAKLSAVPGSRLVP